MDLRPNTASRKDLQQERVPQTTINNVNFAYPASQCVQAGLDLGNHAGIDDPIIDQLPGFGRGK